MISEPGLIQIVTLVLGAITPFGLAWLAIKQQEMQRHVKEVALKTDEAKVKIEEAAGTILETKGEVKETKEKVQENLLRLDGRLTLLLEETTKRARAEGHAAAKAEAEETARQLITTQAEAKEKLVKDKAIADAVVLKASAAKADEQRKPPK